MKIDPSTFLTEVFDLYAPRLYGLLLEVLPDVQAADRCLESTLLRAWQDVQQSGLPPASQRFGWLVRLTLLTDLPPTPSSRLMTRSAKQ